MANSAGFNVKISATGGDAATKELQKLNREMAAAQKPAQDYQKALKRFEDLSGVTKQRAALAEADSAHRESIKKTLGAVDSLGEKLTGMAGKAIKASGAILGLGALGSVAGIVGLSREFGSSSLGLSNMSKQLGLTSDQLLNYHNAAAKVGISSDAMDSAFHSAGQKMQDIAGGRGDPALIGMMKGVLHIDPMAGAFKAKTFAEQSDQILTAISKISDPRLQENVLNMLGAGALLPATENIKKYKDALQSTKDVSVSYSDEGNKLFDSFTDLGQASDQLGRTIADVLGPALTPFIDDSKDLIKTLNGWLTANKDIIDTDLAAWLKPVDDGIKEFVNWLKTADFNTIATELKGFATELKHVTEIGLAVWAASQVGALMPLIKLLGLIPGAGFATAAVGTGLALGAGASWIDSKIPILRRLDDAVEGKTPHQQQAPRNGANYGGTAKGPIDLSAYNGSQNQAFAAFAKMGYRANEQAGIVSNLISESGLKPNAVGDGGHAYGIGQWHEDRQAEFAKVFGHDIHGSSLEEQLRFVDYELHHNEKNALNKLQATNSYFDAGAAFSKYYERPAAVEEAATNRGNLAQQLATSHFVSGNISANINLSGQTNGVTATASSSGSAFKTAPLVSTQMSPQMGS